MIICRKCQRHHPDDVGAGPCACGADLRRDGIALVQAVDAAPFDDSDFDELPALDDELPALDNASPPPPSPPQAPPPPPSPATPSSQPSAVSPPPPVGPAGPPPAGPPASQPSPAIPPPPMEPVGTSPAGPPEDQQPAPGQAAAASAPRDDSASALKGRRRRARSVRPKTPASGAAAGAASAAAAAAAGAVPPPPAPPTPTGMPPTSAPGPQAPTAMPPPPQPVTPSAPPPPPTPPPATPAPSAPASNGVPQIVQADALATAAGPSGDMPAPGRRARSVNPRDLLAAREDTDAPNVGETPPDTTGGTATPASEVTTEMDPTPPPPRAGEQACPECYEPNPLTRRFCRACGLTLPVIEEVDEVDGVEDGAPRRGLRERFKRGGRGGPRGGGRMAGKAQHQAKRHAGRHVPQGVRQKAQMAGSWRQRAKMAGGGGRMKYTSGLSGKAKLKAGAAVLVVIVGIVAMAGPGRDRVLALVGRDGPEGVSPVQAELFASRSVTLDQDQDDDQDQDEEGNGEDDGGTEGSEETRTEAPEDAGSDEVSGFPASAAIDEEGETGAGMPWDLEADPRPTGLVLTLEEPMRVRRILIAPGLPDSVEDGPLVLRPSRVRVCSDTGSCDELTLRDSTSLQKHTLDLGEGVSSLTLTVLEVHEPEHTTYSMAVIAEVRVGS